MQKLLQMADEQAPMEEYIEGVGPEDYESTAVGDDRNMEVSGTTGTQAQTTSSTNQVPSPSLSGVQPDLK